MNIEISEKNRTITAVATGEVRWNDRLLLSGMARPLRESSATALAVDCRGSEEVDAGSLAGVLATCERMAVVEGLRYLGRTA